MKKLMLAALMIGNVAFAEVLTLVPGTESREGVTLATSAVATIDGQEVELAPVASGLRWVRRGIFTAKVYVLQLFVADAATIVKSADEFLPTAAAQPVSAVTMTFVRDVDVPSLAESFREAFRKNSVDLADADVSAFIEVVVNSGAAVPQGALSLVVVKSADGAGETLYYTNSKAGTIIGQGVVKAAPGFGTKVLSIWLGIPADSGLEALKAELLK